jgi:regulator of sigma E protease
MVLACLAIILMLILVIGIHEWGHLLVARLFHITIKRISIGFGRPLLQWTSRHGCEWAWSLWPLGGYVQLLNSRINLVAASQYPYCFDKKPIGQKVCVLLAGACANVIVAYCALTLVYCIGLKSQLPDVLSVAPQSIAAHSGIVSGDRIISVGDRPTLTWRDVGMELIIAFGGRDVKVTVQNTKSRLTRAVWIDLSQVPARGLHHSLLQSLGIAPNNTSADSIILRYSVFGALIHSGQVLLHTTYFFLVVLKQLVTGVIPFSMLLGPLGLLSITVSSLAEGASVFLYFIAILSLAVALVNLLPVPGLDGGSIIYAAIEKIRGKPVSIAFEVLLHRLVFILFCVALVHLLMNDIQRFFIP